MPAKSGSPSVRLAGDTTEMDFPFFEVARDLEIRSRGLPGGSPRNEKRNRANFGVWRRHALETKADSDHFRAALGDGFPTPRDFGKRNLTTCMPIRSGKGLCGRQNTGGFRRRIIGCGAAGRNRM